MVRFLRAAAFAVALPMAAASCNTLATSPDWIGGGLYVSAPQRDAEEDAALARERAVIAKQPLEIGARHILIMHNGSKNKPESVNRTREEAKKIAQDILLKLRGGAKFELMAVQHSDEPGGAQRGGDLGVFPRDKMVKSFGDTAFSLRVGEISEVVETPFGFHIIQRTE